MAEFVSVGKNKYKIVGILNTEDINKINSFKNRTTIVLENTVGLSSELISKINSDRIVFSIKGGLDFESKDKYKEDKYLERTYVSPNGLKMIIKYFEYNERRINPNWNDFEKAMYLYNALVVDMDYAENYENIQLKGTTERSLNGILYSKLVCSGFALVYKEMLDRIGIKNYYQNQKNVHSFNIIEIDGKKYGVDVTWDNNQKKYNNGTCSFSNFGLDSDFYDHKGHKLFEESTDYVFEESTNYDLDFEHLKPVRKFDQDEEIFELSTIDNETLKNYYNTISEAINQRKPYKFDLSKEAVEIREKYLPVDLVAKKLEDEANNEYIMFVIQSFLEKRNALNINEEVLSGLYFRNSYLLDAVPNIGQNEFDLSNIELKNYTICRNGNIYLKNDDGEYESDCIRGTIYHKFDKPLPQQLLQKVLDFLNTYLDNYLKNYINSIIQNLDNLLDSYDSNGEDLDEDRMMERTNIYTKLLFLVKAKEYLKTIGFSENTITEIMKKINNKLGKTKKTKKKEISQKDSDLDFLYAVFSDFNLIWKEIETDQKRIISEDEFYHFFKDVNYMINLFAKYAIVAGKPFKMNDYQVSIDDLQNLLNKIIEDKKKANENQKSI